MLYDRPVNGESSKDSKGKVATDTLAWLGKEFTIDMIVKNSIIICCFTVYVNAGLDIEINNIADNIIKSSTSEQADSDQFIIKDPV